MAHGIESALWSRRRRQLMLLWSGRNDGGIGPRPRLAVKALETSPAAMFAVNHGTAVSNLAGTPDR